MLIFGVGLFAVYLSIFAGSFSVGWGAAFFLASILLFAFAGHATAQWSAAFLVLTLPAAAFLADALLRPNASLDGPAETAAATPTALFVSPFALLLLLLGVALRK